MKAESTILDKIGDRLGLDESKGYARAVALVLVFVVILVGGYFAYLLAISRAPETYSTIYILSSGKTLDLPETVVIGQNNTFNVWVVVENHMRKTVSFEVRLKITGEADPDFPIKVDPVNVYQMILTDGERLEQLATVSIDNPGRHMVFFELWITSGGDGAGFTHNACNLNIEAIR